MSQTPLEKCCFAYGIFNVWKLVGYSGLKNTFMVGFIGRLDMRKVIPHIAFPTKNDYCLNVLCFLCVNHQSTYSVKPQRAFSFLSISTKRLFFLHRRRIKQQFICLGAFAVISLFFLLLFLLVCATYCGNDQSSQPYSQAAERKHLTHTCKCQTRFLRQ